MSLCKKICKTEYVQISNPEEHYLLMQTLKSDRCLLYVTLLDSVDETDVEARSMQTDASARRV